MVRRPTLIRRSLESMRLPQSEPGRALRRLTLRRQYPSASEAARIDRAAAWLEELSAQSSLIVAVTHASFRGQLSRLLAQKGWQAEPGHRSLKPWSTWFFRRKAHRLRSEAV